MMEKKQRKEEFYISIEDKKWLEKMEALVNKLRRDFPNLDREFIVDAFEKNSLNIIRTLSFLKDPINSDHLFSIYEDYVLANDRKSESYGQIVNSKGEELINERERFVLTQTNHSD